MAAGLGSDLVNTSPGRDANGLKPMACPATTGDAGGELET